MSTSGMTEQEIRDAAAAVERQYMIDNGKATLYHVKDKTGKWVVTDWHGGLSFPCRAQSKSRHNIGRWRYDFWFVGPDARLWHGYQIGGNNEIARCRRVKRPVPWYWTYDTICVTDTR